MQTSPTRQFAIKRRSLFALMSLPALTIATLAVGCASKPEVRTDRDPGADLQAYKTFAIQDAHATPALAAGPVRLGGQGPQAGYTTLHEARLAQATRQQLEKQGFTPVSHDPDLRVHLTMKVAKQQELHSTPGARFGGYRGFAGGWGGAQIDSVEVRKGILVIDLVDARRNALVWRGVAEGAIDDADANEPGPAIERAVAEVFAGFKR